MEVNKKWCEDRNKNLPILVLATSAQSLEKIQYLYSRDSFLVKNGIIKCYEGGTHYSMCALPMPFHVDICQHDVVLCHVDCYRSLPSRWLQFSGSPPQQHLWKCRRTEIWSSNSWQERFFCELNYLKTPSMIEKWSIYHSTTSWACICLAERNNLHDSRCSRICWWRVIGKQIYMSILQPIHLLLNSWSKAVPQIPYTPLCRLTLWATFLMEKNMPTLLLLNPCSKAVPQILCARLCLLALRLTFLMEKKFSTSSSRLDFNAESPEEEDCSGSENSLLASSADDDFKRAGRV